MIIAKRILFFCKSTGAENAQTILPYTFEICVFDKWIMRKYNI
jgi:hypothetical protein